MAEAGAHPVRRIEGRAPARIRVIIEHRKHLPLVLSSRHRLPTEGDCVRRALPGHAQVARPARRGGSRRPRRGSERAAFRGVTWFARQKAVRVRRHRADPEVVFRAGGEADRDAPFLLDLVAVRPFASRVTPVGAGLALLDLVGAGIPDAVPLQRDGLVIPIGDFQTGRRVERNRRRRFCGAGHVARAPHPEGGLSLRPGVRPHPQVAVRFGVEVRDLAGGLVRVVPRPAGRTVREGGRGAELALIAGDAVHGIPLPLDEVGAGLPLDPEVGGSRRQRHGRRHPGHVGGPVAQQQSFEIPRGHRGGERLGRPRSGAHPQVHGGLGRKLSRRERRLQGERDLVGVVERFVRAHLDRVAESALDGVPVPGDGARGGLVNMEPGRRGGRLGRRLRLRRRRRWRGRWRCRGRRRRHLFLSAGRNHQARAEQQREENSPPADGCETASERLHTTYLPGMRYWRIK